MFCPPNRVCNLRRACIAAVALAAMTSCVHHAPKTAQVAPSAAALKPTTRLASASSPPPRTIALAPVSPEQRLGTVRVIGARGSFVLIETPSAAATAAIPPGRILHCRPPGVTGGTTTADLRVTPERRQPFVVADVLSGTASVGDVAYLAKDSDPVMPLRNVAPYAPLIPAAAPSPTPEANP